MYNTAVWLRDHLYWTLNNNDAIITHPLALMPYVLATTIHIKMFLSWNIHNVYQTDYQFINPVTPLAINLF